MTSEQIQKKLAILDYRLSLAEKSKPGLALKALAAALEDVRRLRQEVGLEDVAQLNRTGLGAKLLDHRRTRFFVAYAEHGIRLSALLFLVTSHTRRLWKAGKRGQQAGWRHTAEWFGAQIGISGRQIYRLVNQGQELGLLDYLRTRRGMVVWVMDRKAYTKPEYNEKDRFDIGHYYLRLSRLLGLSGSILYRFLKITDDEGNRRRLTAQGAAHRFPWLSQRAASMELQRLFSAGAIQRDRAKFALSANADWAYYWRPRTEKDRRKWRSYTAKNSKNSRSNKTANLVTKWPV